MLRTRPQRRLEAATPGIRWCNKNKNTRENDYGNGCQTSATSSSKIVKLIRKLRWVGLEEKAEQLEKELEQHAVTDTVVSIQNETD